MTEKTFTWEQFPWLRRKVLSGFGLGVGISLIVFAVLYLGQFQKGLMFQGFQSVGMNSSSSSSSSGNGNSSSAISELSKVNLEGSDGKGAVLKTTQLSNLTQQGKNGSFNGDEGDDIEKFHLNATDFLERLRGKNLVFVGDSLNRNMWESLVCILRQVSKTRRKFMRFRGRESSRRKALCIQIRGKFALNLYSVPKSQQMTIFIHGKNGSFETLRLDLMDQTTKMYYDADILIFNTGHWWTHEKTSKGEDYYQEGNYVHPRLRCLKLIQGPLELGANGGGPWNSGGQLPQRNRADFNNTYLAKYNKKMRALEYVIQDMKTPVTYPKHKQAYRLQKRWSPFDYRMEYKSVEEQIAAVHSQDCSHWCLPGVPDTWNELLYVSLLKTNIGSWRY
ncbi:hypothetical protein F8388_014870 [Cannabis sativa]|uniref:Trichome birefringence-like C-terminal domain-containing protein n=1 Tax=Cannabis sativa TaxID=3483 RepID=A0A7J6F613_CANSA|nr:hypothetical protein F8388_014870 [Cannabis sativa]